jgi:hypothetical protein
MLVDKRLTGRAPRRQGSDDTVDELVRRCARAWTPALPILGCGADGAVMEKRSLPVVGKMRQGLLGICCPGKGGAAQLLERMDCALPLPAPLLIDGALSRRLARF